MSENSFDDAFYIIDSYGLIYRAYYAFICVLLLLLTGCPVEDVVGWYAEVVIEPESVCLGDMVKVRYNIMEIKPGYCYATITNIPTDYTLNYGTIIEKLSNENMLATDLEEVNGSDCFEIVFKNEQENDYTITILGYGGIDETRPLFEDEKTVHVTKDCQ